MWAGWQADESGNGRMLRQRQVDPGHTHGEEEYEAQAL